MTGQFPEVLPQSVRETWGLLEAETAWRIVHEPPDWVSLAQAQRRLVFEEFFVFSAGLWQQRDQRSHCKGRDRLPGVAGQHHRAGF